MSIYNLSGDTALTSSLVWSGRNRPDKIFAPVFGPALLLVLAGCHKAGHIGPKPNTGEADPAAVPRLAPAVDAVQGQDTKSLADKSEGVVFDLQAEAGQAASGDGEGLPESPCVINLIGTDYDDHLLGDRQANIIIGEGGDDMIEGKAGDNILYGAYGDDRLFGGGGEDTLYGGAGDDVLVGGWAEDILDGGAGRDTASYTPSDWGVYVELALSGPQTGGTNHAKNHAYGDVLTGIEHLIGSNATHRRNGGDTLLGDENNNRLDGRAGNDILNGRGGDDTLIGGTGRDVLTGGDGADIFVLDVANPAALLELADLITDFSGEDSLDTGDLTHIWMQTDSDSGIRHAENDNAVQDTVIYAGKDDGSGPDTGKILAVLFDYVDPIVSVDFTIQPVMPETI